MLCPKCNRQIRFSDEEKQKAKVAGFVLHTCSSCFDVFRANYQDTLKPKEKKAYLIENGICVYCATRPADEGNKSCSICRDKVAMYRAKWFGSIAEEEERNRKAEERKKEQKPKTMTLEEISAAAAKEGISYGEYVAKHGL